MMDVGRHPNIDLLTYSEVEKISGYVGNFHAVIRKKAKYVDEAECTACGDCTEICPVIVPDEYQQGMSSRKAVYIPFPQSVPSSFLIDMENCLGTNPIACGKCADKCEKHCIDYDAKDEIIEVDAGVVIVATGMDVFDPAPMDEYGYTKFENVVTSMEFERLISAGGPSDGHFFRPTDRKRPKTVGFIQCVGSRTEKCGNPYCSNICCMNTIKDTLLLKDHYPDIEAKVFYIDIRAFGKGFEDLFNRSKAAGVHYIRGVPGEITEDPNTRNLKIMVEDTTSNKLEEYEFDMLVLSVGVTPRWDMPQVQQLLTLSKTPDGFFMEAHPKLKPVDAPTTGVYFAGCAEAPKDVKDSVTQASAAAARAETMLSAGEVTLEAITSTIDLETCRFCGMCARVCPYNAIKVDPKKKTLEYVEALCKGCGTCGAECRFGSITMKHFTDAQIYSQIEAHLADNPQDKTIVFACNWCSYAGADTCGGARLQYPPNQRLIRTMCSGRVDEKWVLDAFKKGAPIVVVSGCHYVDCHYIDANRWTQKRVEKLWDKLEKWGIRPERLLLEWISAAEGQRFQKAMQDIEALRKKVTKEEIDHTVKVLTEEEEKQKEKK
jgi:heterodisulfide reductase subunit A